MSKTESEMTKKKSGRGPVPKTVPEMFEITPELIKEFIPAPPEGIKTVRKPVKRVPKEPKEPETPKEPQIGGTARALVDDLSPSTLKNYNDWIRTYFQGAKRGITGFTNATQIEKFAYDVEKKILASALIDNSKKNHLMAVVHYLKVNKAPQKDIEHFSDQAVAFNQKAEEKYSENRLTSAQIARGLTWEKLGKVYEELLKKNTAEKFKNKSDNIDLMLIAGNYLQPPLRSDLSNILIVNESEVNEDEDTNLLVKKPNGSRYYYMRNYLKVTRSHKKVKISITDKFNKIIDKSLEGYPRKYLIQYVSTDKPLTPKYYQESLKRLLAGSSVDDLRMVFVTHFFDQKRSKNEVKKISQMMLTSPNRVETVYNKITEGADDSGDTPDLPDDIDEFPVYIGKPAEYIVPKPGQKLTSDEQRTNRLAYMKENYQKNKEKIKAQQKANFEKKKTDVYRNRIIQQLKRDKELGIKTVRKDTLEKYGINPASIE